MAERAVVRIGAEVGVPTPTHQLIANLLKPHVAGHSYAGRLKT